MVVVILVKVTHKENIPVVILDKVTHKVHHKVTPLEEDHLDMKVVSNQVVTHLEDLEVDMVADMVVDMVHQDQIQEFMLLL